MGTREGTREESRDESRTKRAVRGAAVRQNQDASDAFGPTLPLSSAAHSASSPPRTMRRSYALVSLIALTSAPHTCACVRA